VQGADVRHNVGVESSESSDPTRRTPRVSGL
jgi:hypothetical protein